MEDHAFCFCHIDRQKVIGRVLGKSVNCLLKAGGRIGQEGDIIREEEKRDGEIGVRETVRKVSDEKGEEERAERITLRGPTRGREWRRKGVAATDSHLQGGKDYVQ
jgi:hypothetical protein